MRCSQLLEKLGRNVLLLNGHNRGLQHTRTYAAAISSADASASDADAPIFAACVLQRLPLVRSSVPPHHAEHLISSRQRGLETGELKDYPEPGRGGAGSKQEKQDLRTFIPVPSVTSADSSGDARSMRRRLSEGLYLVVRSRGKQQQQQGKGGDPGSSPPQGAAAKSGGGGGGGGGKWSFPSAANTGEESLGDTAQRALHSVIGRTHPVFFVGRAPMAHLPVRPQGTTFFMLAQTVDDPWDIRLVEGGPAQDYAWVTKRELLSRYLTDARTRELVSKVL